MLITMFIQVYYHVPQDTNQHQLTCRWAASRRKASRTSAWTPRSTAKATEAAAQPAARHFPIFPGGLWKSFMKIGPYIRGVKILDENYWASSNTYLHTVHYNNSQSGHPMIEWCPNVDLMDALLGKPYLVAFGCSFAVQGTPQSRKYTQIDR